jgi:hypothetical protein
VVLSVDWGGYDYDALQVENLATKANCGAFISQLGGPGTSKLLKRARDAGMITGGYYWNSALNSVQFQLDQFSQWIDADNPDIIILDVEHWWAKWDQYWAAIAGTLPWAQVEKLAPQKISDNAQAVCEGMIKRYPNKYYLNYSAQWFVNGYSPQSAFWLKKYPFHVAAYPDYGMPPYTLPWDQIAAGKFMTVRSGLQTITDYQPSMPTGMVAWDMWQYSSRIKVPGEYYGYDWNYFPGTLDDLKEKCHISTTTPPPPITCEETETKLASWESWYATAPKG